MEGAPMRPFWPFRGNNCLKFSPKRGQHRPKWIKMLSKLLKTQSKGVKRGPNGLKGVKIASKWVPRLQKCFKSNGLKMGSKPFNWLKIGRNGLQLAQNGLQVAQIGLQLLTSEHCEPLSDSTQSTVSLPAGVVRAWSAGARFARRRPFFLWENGGNGQKWGKLGRNGGDWGRMG